MRKFLRFLLAMHGRPRAHAQAVYREIYEQPTAEEIARWEGEGGRCE